MRQVPQPLFIIPFFLIIIIDAMSFGIVTPVLASMVNNSHFLGNTAVDRHLVYGFLQAISPLCYMIGAPLLGYFSDHWGRKKILIYCVIGSFLGLAGYTLSFLFQSLTLLFIARIIVGVTSGSLAVAQAAIADISQGAQKARNIGVIAVAMTIGLVAGPLLGGVLSDNTVISWFNELTPFYVAIALTIASLFILLMILKSNVVLISKEKLAFFSELRNLVKIRRVCTIFIVFLFFELGWSLYYSSLALLLIQKFHLTNKVVGIFISGVGLFLSFFLITGVRFFTTRFSLKAIIEPSLVIGAIVLVIGFCVDNYWIQWVVAVIVALSVALVYSLLITFASDEVKPHQQGLLMGAADSLLSLAFAITGFLSGILAIHNAALPELISAIFFIVAAIIFFITK